MKDSADPDLCVLCKQGKVTKHSEKLAFHQWTNRGYVFCEVTILIGICGGCGARNWDEAADTVIEQAVRQEYDKLP